MTDFVRGYIQPPTTSQIGLSVHRSIEFQPVYRSIDLSHFNSSWFRGETAGRDTGVRISEFQESVGSRQINLRPPCETHLMYEKPKNRMTE